MSLGDPRLDPIRDACRTGSIAAVVSGSIRAGGGRTGAHGYLCPSSHRERPIVHPARALENTMYVVFSNHLGEADGRRLCGHSAIYDPEGKLLADAGPRKEGLALADLDADVLEEVRARSPMLVEARALKTFRAPE